MGVSGVERRRLAGELGEAFAQGLLSSETFERRLGFLYGSLLIDRAALVGDLLVRHRGRAARRWRLLRRRWKSQRGRPTGANAPLVLALDQQQTGERLLVGRDRACDVRLDDPTVSRRHAQLFHREGAWVICDMDSMNGTRLNGRRVGRAPLHPGDELRLGRQRLLID
jgi:hypothetical protein